MTPSDQSVTVTIVLGCVGDSTRTVWGVEETDLVTARAELPSNVADRVQHTLEKAIELVVENEWPATVVELVVGKGL